MSISNIQTSVLKTILTLREKREELADKISHIDRQIDSLISGGGALKSSASSKGAKAKSSTLEVAGSRKGVGGAKRGRKRGATGVKILTALAAAGKAGIKVQDLAKELKMKPQNLYVWFNTTGKRTKGVSKIGPAMYRHNG